MAASAHERLLMTVAGNPGTGNVTVGSAVAGYQGFVAGDNAINFDVVIYNVDTNGNPSGLWEVQQQSTFTFAGTTLSRIAGNVVDGSSGPGALVNFASGTQRVANVVCTSGKQLCPVIIFSGTNFTIQTTDNTTRLAVINDGRVQAQVGFCAGSGVPDVSLYRLAANVWATGTGGSSGNGWIQQTGGEAALAANFTSVVNTFANTNISFNVIAGRSYRITGVLQVGNSTAGEGGQFDFNGGSATATTFFAALSAVGTNTPGTVVSTTLAGVISYTSLTVNNYVHIDGFIKVNAGGTLIFRAAENSAHVSGTLTIGAGSWIALSDTVPL